MNMEYSSFTHMPFQDTYYICQMVHRSLQNSAFLRNIDDFMGDARGTRLLQSYPKFTPLHEYIEYVVEDVINEDYEQKYGDVFDEKHFIHDHSLWVDHLLKAHDYECNYLNWAKLRSKNDDKGYLDYLYDKDILPDLIEQVALEVFHILFANRSVLFNFCQHAAGCILNMGPDLEPEKFNDKGYLNRVSPPQWAKNAVYHRDKGMCVQCKIDLTKLINQRNDLNYDHIVPLAQGGMNDVTNLQLLCRECNAKKSDKLVTINKHYESWYKM